MHASPSEIVLSYCRGKQVQPGNLMHQHSSTLRRDLVCHNTAFIWRVVYALRVHLGLQSRNRKQLASQLISCPGHALSEMADTSWPPRCWCSPSPWSRQEWWLSCCNHNEHSPSAVPAPLLKVRLRDIHFCLCTSSVLSNTDQEVQSQITSHQYESWITNLIPPLRTQFNCPHLPTFHFAFACHEALASIANICAVLLPGEAQVSKQRWPFWMSNTATGSIETWNPSSICLFFPLLCSILFPSSLGTSSILLIVPWKTKDGRFRECNDFSCFQLFRCFFDCR